MVKNLPASAGDMGSIPGSGRSPGEGNGNPLQYSCLRNFMDRESWWLTDHSIAESDTTECLSTAIETEVKDTALKECELVSAAHLFSVSHYPKHFHTFSLIFFHNDPNN